MNTYESEHKPEEVADLPLQLHTQPSDRKTRGNIEKNVNTSWPEQRWKRVTQWLRASTFTPEWLPSPWNHPVSGYVFAILIPAIAIILELLIKNLFGTFVFPGVLMTMALLAVAFMWGTGPGLFATLMGTILINYIVLMPQFSLSLNTFLDIFQTCFILIIGIIISLVVSRIEFARAEAVKTNIELETANAALQKSQGYARHLFDSSLIGILLADEEHIYEANEAFLSMIGYTREELAPGHLSWRELTPPEYVPLSENAIKELKKRGECKPFEREYTREDGSQVPVFIGAALMERDPLQWVSFVLDLTEHKQLEQELANRASEVEAIFESIADGVYVYDTQGQVIRTNSAAQNLYPLIRQPDYTERPFPERIDSNVMRDEQGQAIQFSSMPLIRTLRGETFTGSHSMDILMRRPDRTDVLLNISGAPMLDAGGSIQGGVIVSRDVTERRRLEQRTHEALYALLNMAKVIVQESGATDTIQDETSDQSVTASHTVAQRLVELTRSFLGCKRLSITIVEPETEFLRPLAVVGLSPEQERKWWDEQLQQRNRLTDFPDLNIVQRLQSDEVVLLDMTQPPWNAAPNPYEIRTMLIAPMAIRNRLIGILTLDYGGAEHTYTSEELALTSGVTKLVSLVIEREQLLQERANADVRELALRQAKERMDEFISIVSHELRTPLTTIKGNIQLAGLRLRSSLREVPAGNDVLQSMLEEIQMMLERAERQANVQNRMVSDLLDVSRMRADKLELRLEKCDLAIIVQEIVQDQQSATPKRILNLVMAEQEMAPVVADTERIEQVISNYLSNAMKYSPVGSPVEVQLKKEGSNVRVSVCDKGPGLTPSEQEKVWERFYQVEGIKRQQGSSVGLGLGLYICRVIIEQHHGEVGVESTKGEGSTFWFTLPLAEPDKQEAV
jgi:PAS domain S-box-containing protein